MRSAQRRHRLEKSVRKSNTFFIAKLLIIPVVLALVFLFFKLSTKYWNGSDKIGYVYRLGNGDVAVTVDDPKINEETTFIIPGDTQVDVARNYGSFRIKNIWQLSMNEKLGGSLLSATVTKYFLFPVFLWSDKDAVSLKNQDLSGILKFIFAPKNTNIPLGDRVSMGIFALQVKSIDKAVIDLGASKYLQKTTLNDGQPGYILPGALPQRLTIYFSDDNFSDNNLRVGIEDATGTFGIGDEMGQIIQVLGGKVVSIDKKPTPSQSDCEILGNNTKAVNKIIDLFICKKVSGATTFDLEIRLGSAFAKRF